MKVLFSVVLATISLATSALAGSTDYVVALKHVGHVNSDGEPGHKFMDKAGSVWCHKDGCVGEGVIKVEVDNGDELSLEVFPTLDNFAVSIMCRDKNEELTSCAATRCSNRGGANCFDDLYVQRDTSTEYGCTVVGDGADTEEVEILVTCE